ncbi:putative intracellular protease/amidase [Roseibium hamelinense]|uniref:Putative intracellular protease/amidase n=1 Tax=Roseibium hamelinense TaxID=150831 RepID=A0A562SDG5_9HYPH|nr:type 1 glutamine amidotransferase domain-containing protein [Roseibium hamelinense]MTI42095.1 type 1 glutamine amidotransferase domain-containing protein [Roseibium hamelinense]TWI78690.1 putative intracellular protease/amidase [Roseibium hamelinense]
MSWIKYIIGSIAVLAAIVYFGLPPALKAMGFHPHYDVPEFDLAGHRALIVTTSHGTLGETGRATGVFGSEMTVPYYVFLEAGLDVDIASIKGGEIPVEPWSMSWPLATPEDLRFKDDPAAMQMLQNSLAITEVDPDAYDVIFLAGGWGAAYDLAQSTALAEVVTRANANGAILGSVCHGALGLVNAEAVDGSPLIERRRVTGVTDKQIAELGIEITPKHPETEMRATNAVFEAETGWRDFFATLTVVDGNLVTGQNQNSGYETSHRILELLADKQSAN